MHFRMGTVYGIHDVCFLDTCLCGDGRLVDGEFGSSGSTRVGFTPCFFELDIKVHICLCGAPIRP